MVRQLKVEGGRMGETGSWDCKAENYLNGNSIHLYVPCLACNTWKRWHKFSQSFFLSVFCFANFWSLSLGKHGGTLVNHLLQDLKVPGSNLDKDQKFIELEMMLDLWDSKYIKKKSMQVSIRFTYMNRFFRSRLFVW